MDKEKMIDLVRIRARENHANGLNCGESTFKALLDTLREAGMTDFPAEAVALASGFGGGVGSSGNTCCALLGACMGVSCIHGRKNPLEKPTVEERKAQMGGEQGLYRLYNNLVFDFEKKNNSTKCWELMGSYDYYSQERVQLCRNIIGEAAALGLHWLFVGMEEGYAHPFNFNIMGKEK